MHEITSQYHAAEIQCACYKVVHRNEPLCGTDLEKDLQ